MSKIYFPFNAVLQNGIPDRAGNAETFAAYLQNFFTNGVILKESTSLQVYASEGMQLQIRPGIGFINGRIFITDVTENITIETAPATLSRIDRVILRLDLVNRLIDFAVLKGEPASAPEAPALTRNYEVWELCLADVSIGPAYMEITQAAITDRRADSAVCGIVAAAIKQIDTSTFYAQFQAQFNAWFETVKGQVEMETLAGVQGSLQALRETVTDHIADTGSHIKNLGYTSGTLKAYTITAEGVELKEFDTILVIFHGENLAGATLAVNDATGPIYKTDGTEARVGEIKSGVPYLLTYFDGKYFFKSGGGPMQFAAGDAQLYLDAESARTSSTALSKMKAIKIYAGGSVRVKMNVYSDTYTELYLRRNSENLKKYILDNSGNQYYQEDVAISPGDEIALWGKTNGVINQVLMVKSFEICTETGKVYERIV